MDFDQIVLTDFEMSVLKDSKTKSVPIAQCERLLRNKFVQEERKHIPGLMPLRLETCRITQRGMDYLLWSEQKLEKLSQQRAEEAAKDARSQRFEIKKIFLAAVISSAITLLIEHFGKIVQVLISLFQ